LRIAGRTGRVDRMDRIKKRGGLRLRLGVGVRKNRVKARFILHYRHQRHYRWNGRRMMCYACGMKNTLNDKLMPNTKSGFTAVGRKRKGMVAGLPPEMRLEVNRRLDNNETYRGIAGWLAEQGHSGVTEGHVKSWFHGGYQDWRQERWEAEEFKERVERARGLS